MSRITIVTPWYGAATADLLSDYRAAVRGAEVIAVDNGGPDEARSALAAAAAEDGWRIVGDGSNYGFAGGNNIGYSSTTGDVIVFLNSDITAPPELLSAIVADVRDGAIYGPSLQHQLVAGRWLPYLEGWCVAATRATWNRLIVQPDAGPWDSATYPGPYWEDNDLCWRAAQIGVDLIQTAWPLQHKGGRSAGPLIGWAQSFEANRAAFAQRVLRATPEIEHTPTLSRYYAELARDSDIRHHLPLLRSLARGNVIELGTRGGASTIALLAGVERNGGQVLSIDIDDCSSVAAGHPHWAFLRGDSTDERAVQAAIEAGYAPADLLLIDTLHTRPHVLAELQRWEPVVAAGGTICVHDIVSFPGVRVAIEHYVAGRQDLDVTYVLPNNGMAVIRKAAA